MKKKQGKWKIRKNKETKNIQPKHQMNQKDQKISKKTIKLKENKITK